MDKKRQRPARFLLQMRDDLRAGLEKEAEINGRTLTAEINARLRVSLGAHGPTLQGILAREAEGKNAAIQAHTGTLPPSYTAGPTPGLTTNDNGPAPALSDLDRTMLALFRTMPPEKQLALLSLFK